MEKLIILLNEFLDDWQERVYACYSLEDWFDKFFHTKDGEWTIEESQIISKKFWFIEWLLKNDEIDYKKLIKDIAFCEIRALNWWILSSLTMILSIEDDPIEYLISVLR